MPVSEPVRVTASHIRWPYKVFGRAVYRLITADAGDYVSAIPPDIYDANGQPVTLTAELSAGSVIRIEHDGRGAMTAVQLLKPIYSNPFSRLLVLPRFTPWEWRKTPVFWGFRQTRDAKVGLASPSASLTIAP